jgi:hypothetical protein
MQPGTVLASSKDEWTLSDNYVTMSDSGLLERIEIMDSTKISVRLDGVTEQRLRQEARSAGKNESEIVRDALAAYFARRRQGKSALTLAQQAGVIGCAKGLPPDLSTNKEHFEGFGR